MERLNTVFKFYLPAWTLLGAAAVLFALETRGKIGHVLLPLWAVALSAHLLFGTYARTGHYQRAQSLEGLDRWRTSAPSDTAVIEWMREKVRTRELDGTLLEAVGGSYRSFGRVMTITGLPGYLAWEGYAGMLVTLGNDPELGRRTERTKAIFNGDAYSSCEMLHGILRDEKIRYVFVGDIELATYRRDALDRLTRCLPTLFLRGTSRLLGGV